MLLKKLRDALECLKGRLAGRNKEDVEKAISMVSFGGYVMFFCRAIIFLFLFLFASLFNVSINTCLIEKSYSNGQVLVLCDAIFCRVIIFYFPYLNSLDFCFPLYSCFNFYISINELRILMNFNSVHHSQVFSGIR